jgi:hypothetical protein
MATESQMGMGDGSKRTLTSLILSQLTDAERSRLLARLDKDSDDAVREVFAWKYVRQAFVDPLVWGYALLNHGFAFTLYTLSLFLVCLYQGYPFTQPLVLIMLILFSRQSSLIWDLPLGKRSCILISR